MRKVQSSNPENIAYFANLGLLGVEASNKGIIDSGCSSTVAGEEWLNTYLDALSEHKKVDVVYRNSNKWFKFGGGELLKSLKQVELPCVVGGKHVRLLVEIVKSHIPLLISSATLKRLDAILDVGNDRISLFGEWFDCDKTSSGLYVIDLGTFDNEPFPVEKVLVALDNGMNKSNPDVKYLTKIHRQFGHVSKQRFCNLLKDANKWKEEYSPLIHELYENCVTCKLFAKTPPRPVVALPPASEFCEVLTMDLKECSHGRYQFILHLIDAFTRYSVSVFLTHKGASSVVNAIMCKWVAVFERPKRI